jgi:hypothetical protein
VDQLVLPGTADLLQATYPVTKINLADVFLTEMRGLAAEHGADWAQLLRADEKLTRTLTMPAGLRSYVTVGWQRTTDAVIARASAPRTILLVHDAGLIARYHDDGGHTCLVALQQAARLPGSSPYGLWLLCPSEAPKTTGPNLDGRTVEAIDGSEWSVLDRRFLDSLRQAA